MTMDTEATKSRRGVRREVKDPGGQKYLVQAAPSGYVQWSRGGIQGPVGFVMHTAVTWLLYRVVFRGGWTVIVWRGDWVARKRTTVVKRRYRTKVEAIAAWEDLTTTITRSGPPETQR
jgi:hypothetical protein